MEETYGERVARIRDELGLKQPEFAAKAGVPYRTLQDIENGKVKRPQQKTRKRIDAVLGLHPEGETAEGWPSELKAFLDILGAFLMERSQQERTAFINETIRRLAHWRD